MDPGVDPGVESDPSPLLSAKPNIIYIVADDLGWGDLGSYGQKKIQTPRLDAMAAQGVRFTSHYSGPVCAPGRYTLLTGRDPGHARIRSNSPMPGLEADEPILSEMLKGAGYRTGIIGKWGMGTREGPGFPTRKGFDYFYGYLGHTEAHDYFPTTLWRNNEEISIPGGTYSHDLFTEEALAFLDREKAKTFFLYLAFTIPHAGIGGMPVPNLSPYGGENWPDAEKRKAAMITRLDTSVGQVLEKLKALGLDRNTVVFFSSDNGPHSEGGVDPEFHNSNGPLRGIKRDVYEGGIRTPLLVRWPNTIGAGRVVRHRYANWDFMKTAAELAGIDPPSTALGISMVPALAGSTPVGHRTLYHETFEKGFRQAVVEGPYKAVRYGRDVPVELFNLDEDPGESTNVAASFKDVATKLAKRMAELRTESVTWPTPDDGNVVLYAEAASVVQGRWARVSAPTAAGGAAMTIGDQGLSVDAALSSPAHYFELTFRAEKDRPYHLWIRGKAKSDSATNDSVFVQFNDSLSETGAPKHRIGTGAAAVVSLKACDTCVLRGWGWVDGVVDGQSPPLFFETTGTHRVRIQVREDGISVDQIVLSPSDYSYGPPGEISNDDTIVPKTGRL